MFPKIKNKSFTIVEVLVVIGVIAIVVTLVYIAASPAITRSRITQGILWSRHIYQVLGAEAVGIWELDEGEGITVYDSSGNNNNGTLGDGNCVPGSGSCPSWTDENPFKYAGVQGRYALSFDTDYNDYVQIPHSEIQNTVFGTSTVFTLAAWVYPKVWYSYPTVINKATCGNWSCTTNGMWATNEFGFCCVMGSNVPGNPDGGAIIECNKPSAGNWYHLVCTADGTYLKLYINGALKGTDLISRITYPRSANTAPIILSRRTIGEGPSLNGLIDEVRIYSSTLTAMQIKTLYYAGLNKLLAKGEISQKEYLERIKDKK